MMYILVAKVEPFELHDFGVDVAVNDTNEILDQSAIRYPRKKVGKRLKLELVDILVA
jgi:hypothetical protein